MPGTHHVLEAAGGKLTACRRDECGTTGVVLWVQQQHAAELYQRLAETVGGLVPDVEADGSGAGAKRAIRGRGIGHLAYNTARIEAGTPIYHIDFGPDTLPHETGAELLGQAASFTKGCYLGQEIVARMQNLGHPKRVLCGLRLDDDRLPIAGAQVTDAGDDNAVIGAVTSSTLSPMRGGNAIAFAMIKWARHQPDTSVKVAAEGELVNATVQSLCSLG
jgi:folate-binding protein YgfZ